MGKSCANNYLGDGIMRIAIIGRTRILMNSLQLLKQAGHQIAIIATCKASPEYDIKEKDFQDVANNLKINFINTQNINKPEIVQQLKDANAEIAISVNWISIIGPEVCNVFKYGVLNAHAGDLPRYRGNAPIAWAILQNEQQVGLSIHQMDPFELDAGNIFKKDFYSLCSDTYIGQVTQWVEKRTPELFLDTVNGIETKKIQSVAQPTDPLVSLRCYPRRPEDGKIQWTLDAEYLARLVRASSEPFSGAFSFYKNKKLIIWKARYQKHDCPTLCIPGQVLWRNTNNGEVGIGAGDGQLILQEVEYLEQGRQLPTLVFKSLRDRLSEPTYIEEEYNK